MRKRDKKILLPEGQCPEEQRDAFLSLLSRRSYTKREAARRLRDLGADDVTAEVWLDEAQEMGLLDDAAYARLFAQGHPSWGSNRVAYELRRRGVEEEDVQAALEEIDEEARLRELIKPWLEAGLDGRKLFARLLRRGFEGRTLRAVLSDAPDDELD